MVSPTASGCINHPGMEAVARCKMCGKPVCGACVEKGPTGAFCSTVCRDKHEAFVQRAQEQADRPKPAGANVRKLVSILIKLSILLAVVVGIGVLSVMFQIPVLEGFTRKVMGVLGPYVPFF